MINKTKILVCCNSHDDISEIMLGMDDMKLFKRIREVRNSGYYISATCNVVSLAEKYNITDELFEKYGSRILQIVLKDNNGFKYAYS